MTALKGRQRPDSDGDLIDHAKEAMREDLASRVAKYSTFCLEPLVRYDDTRHQLVGVAHTGRLEGDYRWCLDVRFLDAAGSPVAANLLTVIQLNPSRASETRSDATRGKVEQWARVQGYGGARFLNLFAIRSPYTSYLMDKVDDVLVGRDNDAWLRGEAGDGVDVITAWGGSDKKWLRDRIDLRVSRLVGLLDRPPPHFVGRLTKGRYPLHGRCWNRYEGNVGGPEPLLHQWTAEDWKMLGRRPDQQPWGGNQ